MHREETTNPYESPSSAEASRQKSLREVENLVRDARLAILTTLIPILGLIYLSRVTDWYRLKKQLDSLEPGELGGHTELLTKFHTAIYRLWFAALLWPVLLVVLVVLF